MKKLIALLLTVLLVLAMCSCQKPPEDSAYVEQPVAQQNTPSTPEQTPQNTQTPSEPNQSQQITQPQKQPDTSVPPTQESTAPTTYKDLTGRLIMSWQTVRLSGQGGDLKLELQLPSDWTLTKGQGGTYRITRGGKEIGSFSSTAFAEPAETAEFDFYKDTEGEVMAYRQVAAYQEQGSKVYYRSFELDGERGDDRVLVYGRVLYEEMDDVAARKLTESVSAVSKIETFPTLSQTNGAKRILVIGNSFVNTSKIGSFLEDMFKTDGTGFRVEAVSRGMASIEDVAEDELRMATIKDGLYSYVFLCGFYNTIDDVECYADVAEACRASKTALIAFPAHNESRDSLSSVELRHADFCLLDWKGELDDLIESGVDRWDLCYDDSYDHSTPLAGYVGAHMIYRTLFQKVPPKLTERSPLTASQVTAKLGSSYVNKDGKVPVFTGVEMVF